MNTKLEHHYRRSWNISNWDSTVWLKASCSHFCYHYVLKSYIHQVQNIITERFQHFQIFNTVLSFICEFIRLHSYLYITLKIPISLFCLPKDQLIDWLIDWLGFHAVFAIFQTCIGGDFKVIDRFWNFEVSLAALRNTRNIKYKVYFFLVSKNSTSNHVMSVLLWRLSIAKIFDANGQKINV